ncbi:short-chain dehydrogenase [Rhexocercosporidium sp. MPI-PUGE-AT-0058]|nr:short-chain dehydrogenase [Rhexocercosporidium sp. MPI-PUGE-AT-0058]
MPSFNKNTTGNEVVAAFASSLAGKTVLITGPSSGSIGAETALSLATGSPSTILLLGRTSSKVLPVLSKITSLNPSITTKFITCDLASQVSIRTAAAEINSAVSKIDYVFNTAGVMAVPTYQTSAEDVEMQFAINHLGHFLLTNLIMPRILEAGDGSRIVNVSSTGFEMGGVNFEDVNFDGGKTYDCWVAYAQSKTANVLFAAALAAKFRSKGIQSFALQPGLVMESNLSAHLTPEMWETVMKAIKATTGGDAAKMETPKTLQEGCATSLVAALDPSIAEQSGGFLQDCVVRPVTQDYAQGKENFDKLWALSEKLVGEKFAW